jgi:hypothetical protein
MRRTRICRFIATFSKSRDSRCRRPLCLCCAEPGETESANFRILVVGICLAAVYVPLFHLLRLPGWDTLSSGRLRVFAQTRLARPNRLLNKPARAAFSSKLFERHRRDGRRQGLPQRCGAGKPGERRSADIYFREAGEEETALGKQGRAAAGCLRKSAASTRKLWPAAAPETGRIDREELRALLRNWRNEKDASPKTREHSQATVDSRWGVQFEFDLQEVVGIRNAARVEKSAVFAYFCVPLAVPSQFRACEPHKLFLFIITIQSASKSPLSKIQTSPLRKM